MRSFLTTATVTMVLALLGVPAVADATFPGADGRIFFAASRGLASMRPDGLDVRTLTSGYDGWPGVSGDGRKVVFARYDPANGKELGMYVIRLASGAVQHVPGTGVHDCCPAFGPDSHTIVFTRSRPVSAGPVIRTVRLDGSHARRLVDTYGASQPSFAPDGKTILFDRDGNLYRIRTDGAGLHRVVRNGFSGSFSPNGHRIVFVRNNQDLFILRLRDHHLRRLTNDDFQERNPVFAPGGKRIVFERVESEQGDDTKVGTWVIRTDGTHEHRIRAAAVGPLDWQPLAR